MRQAGTRKQRSQGWWAVFLCACLAMGVYIAFDLLDVDGSNLRDVGPGTAVAAESASADGERFIPQIPSTLEAQGLAPLRVEPWLTAESLWLSSPTRPEISTARRDQIRPRRHLVREALSTTSPNGEPV